jgi:hypothetical protein
MAILNKTGNETIEPPTGIPPHEKKKKSAAKTAKRCRRIAGFANMESLNIEKYRKV